MYHDVWSEITLWAVLNTSVINRFLPFALEETKKVDKKVPAFVDRLTR